MTAEHVSLTWDPARLDAVVKEGQPDEEGSAGEDRERVVHTGSDAQELVSTAKAEVCFRN